WHNKSFRLRVYFYTQMPATLIVAGAFFGMPISCHQQLVSPRICGPWRWIRRGLELAQHGLDLVFHVQEGMLDRIDRGTAQGCPGRAQGVTLFCQPEVQGARGLQGAVVEFDGRLISPGSTDGLCREDLPPGGQRGL